MLFWVYHSPDPCQLFVPVFVTRLNWPPAEWPYSALNWLVVRANSATASGITVELLPVTPRLLSSTPSTVKLLSRGRVPPTDPPTPVTPPGMATTLGAKTARFRGLPLSVPDALGSCTSVALKLLFSVADVVCTATVPATTSTVSLAEPISSWASATLSWSARAGTSFFTSVLNPLASTDTLYK